jgi:hypothetical protein
MESTYGTCQYCGRGGLKLKPGGAIPHHGHNNGVGGYKASNSCRGSGYWPFEKSGGMLESEIEHFERRAAEYTTTYPGASQENIAKNAAWCAREIAFCRKRLAERPAFLEKLAAKKGA